MSVSNQINTIVECSGDQGECRDVCVPTQRGRSHAERAFPRRAWERGREAWERGKKSRAWERGQKRAFPRRAWERGKRGNEGTREAWERGTDNPPGDKRPAKAENQNRFTTTPAVTAIWNRSWEMSLTFRMRAKRSNFSGTMIVSPGSSLVLEPLDISQR